jgi:hypothetical protein
MFGTDTFCQRYAPYYSFPDRKLSRADEDYVTKVRITTGLHHIHFEGSDWDTMYEGARTIVTALSFLAHASFAHWRPI